MKLSPLAHYTMMNMCREILDPEYSLRFMDLTPRVQELIDTGLIEQSPYAGLADGYKLTEEGKKIWRLLK